MTGQKVFTRVGWKRAHSFLKIKWQRYFNDGLGWLSSLRRSGMAGRDALRIGNARSFWLCGGGHRVAFAGGSHVSGLATTITEANAESSEATTGCVDAHPALEDAKHSSCISR